MHYLPPHVLGFPSPYAADESGLLAIGGDLSTARLLLAYRNGIFPWYNAGEPILWWSPDPRFVLFPAELHIPRSLRPVLNRQRFHITLDRDFEAVIRGCAQPRPGQSGTWITGAMADAYCRMHELGYAHSVEVWQGDELAGGLYGMSLGKAFFGESMFARISDASKAGFVLFVKKAREMGLEMIDCQVHTRHLERFGARFISRDDYLKTLRQLLRAPDLKGDWSVQLDS